MSSAIKMVLCPVSLLDLLLVLCHFSSPFTRYPQPPARSYVRTLETLLYFVHSVELLFAEKIHHSKVLIIFLR